MTSVAIDTLRYSKRLRAVGFTEEQAEVQAEALTEAVRDSLVSKADLDAAVVSLREEMAGIRSEMGKIHVELRSEMKQMQNELRVEIRDLHTGLLRWLIPLIIGQTAVVAALVKLL